MGEREDLISNIQEFKKNLSDIIDLQELIIFGSSISGDYTKDSDVDLIIVSPSFRGKKFYKRALGFHRRWNIDLPVDFICFTPEEFEEKRKQVSIVSEALKEGVRI